MQYFWSFFFLIFLHLGFLSLESVEAQTSECVSLESIHAKMDEIFSHHVSQKSMTETLMQKTIQDFIENFDINHVYLLQMEVHPYIESPKSQLKQYVREYEQNKYTVFENLDGLFQQAIDRARKIRKNLLQKNLSDLTSQISKQTPDMQMYRNSFANSENNLISRQRDFLIALYVKSMGKAVPKDPQKAFQDIENTIEEFENTYLFVDRNGHKFEKTAKNEAFAFQILQAMTESLDAHSSFMDPIQARMLRQKLEKEYVGIGLVIEERDSFFYVRDLVPRSPAAQNGKISQGDLLVSIDNKKVEGLSLDAVNALLTGQKGTYVNLELSRTEEQNGKKVQIPIRIKLERQDVILQEGRVDSSFVRIHSGIIGIIGLHSFYQNENGITSESDVIKAYEDLSKKGAVKGLILDLRDNRGGFLMQAVKVAGLFIKSGVIVAAKYSNGSTQYFRDLDPSVLFNGPVIILTSKLTASAAEIVALALKDYGVAIIVGDEHTYGKGSIQTQTVTDEKQNQDSYFKVTVGTYYTVSGASPQLQGVKADIVVPSIYAQSKIGEEFLPNHMGASSISPTFKDALQDVSGSEKGWYEQYYIPFLQKKDDRFRRWIPELKKLSAERLKKDRFYSELLSGQHDFTINQSGKVQDVHYSEVELEKIISKLQLEEAENIMKDLIDLSSSKPILPSK